MSEADISLRKHDIGNLQVPNRFKYIVWLQDLLDSTSPDYRESYDPQRRVIGVDIGTGASAIYPLLGTRQRPNWRFVGTECDERSFEYARLNTVRNRTGAGTGAGAGAGPGSGDGDGDGDDGVWDEDDRILLVKTEDATSTAGENAIGDGDGKKEDRDSFLVPVEEVLERFERIDFVQTNPPFYTSSRDHLASSKGKARAPNSVCTGSASEMMTGGGEIGFVSRLIAQSLSTSTSKLASTSTSTSTSTKMIDVKSKVQWWSSMLGKLSGVAVIIDRLKREGCDNWAVGEIVQGGGKTRRWLVAWSWWSLRPSVTVARGVKVRALNKSVDTAAAAAAGRRGPGGVKRKYGGDEMGHGVDENEDEDSTGDLEGGLLPFPSEFDFSLQGIEMQDVITRLNTEINDLSAIRWQWKLGLGAGLGIAQNGDCWSRKARRRTKVGVKDAGQRLGDQYDDHDLDGGDGKEPQLAFKIRLQQQRLGEVSSAECGKAASRVIVTVRWLQGRDHVLFESFCGWLRRKLDLDRR